MKEIYTSKNLKLDETKKAVDTDELEWIVCEERTLKSIWSSHQ